MSQRTGEILIIIAVIALNLWLVTTPGGRTVDYQEYQLNQDDH